MVDPTRNIVAKNVWNANIVDLVHDIHEFETWVQLKALQESKDFDSEEEDMDEEEEEIIEPQNNPRK